MHDLKYHKHAQDAIYELAIYSSGTISNRIKLLRRLKKQLDESIEALARGLKEGNK